MIEHLPFDSSLFGYPVGKCLAGEFWDERNFFEDASDFELVYIFSKKPLKFCSDKIALADIKLTFEKLLVDSVLEDPSIQNYTGPLSDQLLDLAIESGIYSRFHTDPGFKKREFEKLYQIWIQSAVDRQEVLLAEDCSGFVSCTVSENTAQIGLIAVDKNHRGKGWAKRLMHAAERKALLQGAETLIVSTQELNIPASTLYKSLGYELKERMYIYHFWNV